MAIRAKMKFRGDIPWNLEHMLITKLGFRIFSRNNREWIIVEKVKSNFQPEVLENGVLSEDVQNKLIKRCNTIVNHFNDPEVHIDTIRIRLNNVAQTLPPFQRKFVHEWMSRNLKEDQ